MESKLLCELIMQAKEYKDERAFDSIFKKFKPLIIKYCGKLYFMEREDAIQEIYLAIVEAIHSIRFYNNEISCLLYLQKAVQFKYIRLCKANIKKNNETMYYFNLNDYAYGNDEYKDIEFLFDINKEIHHKSQIQKQIVELLINGMNSSQIAVKIGVSRQYIYKVKKDLQIIERINK